LAAFRYNDFPRCKIMPTGQTILETALLLRQKKLSPVELTRACLEKIQRLDSALNAFITVTGESALAQAQTAEAEIMRGEWRGPLHGVTIGLKDVIDTAGILTTAAAGQHKDRIPAEDADVVRRLKDAGAVIIGKNNLHEFAYGGSSMISYFGEVHNPWDVGRIAGGSSGGSSAAVAAGLCHAAIGTDTAGSIREPAALCGCVGLKPTYGRVSSRGVIPLSWSLDHVGPIAASVTDAALVLQAIAGYDARDTACFAAPLIDYASALRESPNSVRVGVLRPFFYEELDPEIARAVEAALRVVHGLVKEIRDVAVEVPTDRTVQAVESYAYHAENVRTTPELYHPETLRRIMTGAEISAADYVRCRRELELARRKISDVFADVDVLVTPTTSIPAPSIAQLKAEPDDLRPAELKLLRNTRPFNVWGLPAISLPCGFTQSGLPIGLQIISQHGREDLVLRLAYAYEQATEWHARRPLLE
jgi:aspartyl-tRNA(Asn)/glutamyl-tRNA(Gln) amidotransferase subunit A